VAHLRYAPRSGSPEGLRYVIETGAISAIQRPRWYVRGSEGAYIQYGRDAQEAALNRGEVGPRVMDPENAPRVTRYVDGKLQDVTVEQVPGNYLEYYRNVAAAIRGEEELAVTPENVLHSIRIIEAAFQAGKSRQVVRPDSLG
jgi:scyllo-inositol 2-dehydrogenase (NADP+)